jgi:hypothetical protein
MLLWHNAMVFIKYFSHMRSFNRFTAALLFAASTSVLVACAADKDLVDRAVKEYEAGNMERAIPLLIQAVKEDDGNGKAHYYLGLAEKRLGKSADAIKQLEGAIKLCPTPMLQALVKEALSNGAAPPAQQQGQQHSNDPFGWLSNIGSNVSGMFGGAQKPAAGNSADGSQWPWFRPPDLMAPVRDLVKNTRQWIKSNGPAKSNGGTAPPGSLAAGIIHMGELQSLVGESHTARWVSEPGGVQAFYQAPEFTPEWDRWIYQFRRAINIILTRHLLHETNGETEGTASVVFSLDKDRNLKGCVCSGTGDDTLKQCMVETIKELNHNKGLAFPKTAITGWNFRMQWDFGRLLSMIKLVRERQEEIAKLAMKKATTTLDTNAKLKLAQEGAKAKIGKLSTSTRTKVAVRVATINVKTELVGQILPKAKPLELKAIPLKLSDLIGKNVAPPPDFADVVDAMYMDALQMQQQQQEEAQKTEAEKEKEKKEQEEKAKLEGANVEKDQHDKGNAAPSLPEIKFPR